MSQAPLVGPEYGFLPERGKPGRPLAVALIVGLFGLMAVSAVWYLTTRTPDFTTALSRVRAALAKVRSAESTLWLMHGGKRVFRQKRYFDGGRWRIERADGEVRLFTINSACVRVPGAAKAACFGFSDQDAPFPQPSYYFTINYIDLLPLEPPIDRELAIGPPVDATVSPLVDTGGKAFSG